jgi:hypothetical protein
VKFDDPQIGRRRGNSSCQPSHSEKQQVCILQPIKCIVVFYGCETWSFTLREECSLRAFENRVLGGIFGPKRDEVTGEGRKLHTEELNDK